MSRSTPSPFLRAFLLAGVLLLIAACGNKGDLVRPPAGPAKAPAPTSVDNTGR